MIQECLTCRQDRTYPPALCLGIRLCDFQTRLPLTGYVLWQIINLYSSQFLHLKIRELDHIIPRSPFLLQKSQSRKKESALIVKSKGYMPMLYVCVLGGVGRGYIYKVENRSIEGYSEKGMFFTGSVSNNNPQINCDNLFCHTNIVLSMIYMYVHIYII